MVHEDALASFDSISDDYARLGLFVLFFIPLIALVAGYMSVVGERQSGSLRVLMSYPFSRSDVLTGKVVGRSVVVGLTILFGFVVITVLGVPLTADFAPVDLLLVALLTVLLGVTFTAIAVAISASTASRGTALAWVIGIFFFLLVMWEALAVGIYYLVEGSRPGLVVEPWYFALYQLNPIESYRIAIGQVTDSFVWPMVQLGLEDIDWAQASAVDLRAEARVEGSAPFYLSPWFSVLTSLAWIAVPLAIGYRRFTSADLD